MIDREAVRAKLNSRIRFSRLLNGRSNAILTYHSVGDPNQFGNVSETRLESDLAFLTRAYEVVDLPDVLNGGDPSDWRKVAITFDDGYANFYTTALSLLQKFDTPATVFVSPSFVGDRSPDLIERRHHVGDAGSPVMMYQEQLAEVAQTDLVTVGNHTHTHRRLSEIDDEAVKKQEILGAKATLEEWLGRSIDRFSYPYGSYDETSVDIVRQSHEIAVTTHSGLIRSTANEFLLPRIDAHRSPFVLRWELRPQFESPHRSRGHPDDPD